MSKNKNFFFVDDSGSRIWENPYSKEFCKNPPDRKEENLPYWRRNYFVLAGIHVSEEKLSVLNDLINKEKEKYFKTKDVEIKSEWLRMPEKRKRKYTGPYGITEQKLKEFVEKFWYSLFSLENFTAQAFILDKRFYAKRDKKPIALITQILFNRLVMYPADNVVVVFDQMEDAIKSKKGDQGVILNVSNDPMNTSPFFNTYSHSEVRFERSRNSNFLQIADTIAYNIFRHFVSYGNEWENKNVKEEAEMYEYEYLEKIKNCFHKKDGLISDVGIVKVPDTAHTPWHQKKTSQK